MPRISHSDPRTRDVVNGCLLPLFAQYGSVNALAEALNQELQALGMEDRIYPNRIHTLFSDDPARSVNHATIELVKNACTSLLASGEQRKVSDAWKRLSADVLQRWQAGTKSREQISAIAAETNAPPAAVRYLLEQSGQVVKPEDMILASRETAALEHSVGNRDFEPRVAPAADHCEQPCMHLLNRLILRLHGYSTNVAMTWRGPSPAKTIRRTVGVELSLGSVAGGS